jgi:hypothetical protein
MQRRTRLVHPSRADAGRNLGVGDGGAPGGAALAYYEGARLRTARRRADRKVRLKGPRQPLAPPGAPFPFLGKRKKGSRRVPRLKE